MDDHIVYTQRDEQTNLDLWAIELNGRRELSDPRHFRNNELQARAFTGRPLDRVRRRRQRRARSLRATLSRANRTAPGLCRRRRAAAVARRPKRALLHRSPIGPSSRSPLEKGEPDPFGAPHRLFRAPIAGGPDDARDYYATAADGGQFSTRQRVRRRRRHRHHGGRQLVRGGRGLGDTVVARSRLSVARGYGAPPSCCSGHPLLGGCRQRALPVRRCTRNAVAMLAGRRRRPRRALEQAGLAAATAW